VLDAPDATFDELVERVRRRAMTTYEYAYYDQAERDAMIELVGRDRGFAIDLAVGSTTAGRGPRSTRPHPRRRSMNFARRRPARPCEVPR
jgi:hypothetical protein